MKNNIRQFLNQIQRDRSRQRRWNRVLLALSIFVVCGVLWQLKITGITMTAEALCGYLQHQHEDACVQKTQICAAEESEDHFHGDDCYESSLICGYEEEHTHTVQCYSDTDAGLETAADWEATLPQLTGQASADLVAVARSQLGYGEVSENYKVADDGVTQMGYTRYGEWYGNPHGNWSAMFASFCLHYAEHPAYEALSVSGAESMRNAAAAQGYCGESDDLPRAGDLLFLDRNADGAAEAVAIVTGSGDGYVTAIEGDRDGVVCEVSILVEDEIIADCARFSAPVDEEEPKLDEPSEEEEEPVIDEPAEEEEEPELDEPSEEEEEPENDLVDAILEGQDSSDSITLRFRIGNGDYTADNGLTHVVLRLPEKTNSVAEYGYSENGGLAYTYWTGSGSSYRYKVTGTGTLMECSIPAGTSLSANGMALPAIEVTNINGSSLSLLSVYNWVTGGNMICNNNTVFTEDTTLSLSLYPTGGDYQLNWVCNCTGTSDNAGSHSVFFHLSSYPSATLAPGQSLSAPYIPTAEAVNSAYTGSDECNVGSDNNMTFVGWYLKNETTGEEVPLHVGTPFLAEYADPNAERTIKVYAHWEVGEVEPVTATFLNGETTVATLDIPKGSALGTLPDAPAAETGKYFLGWQAEGDTAYAEPSTRISRDTTFHAIYGDCVAVTFLVEDEPYGQPVYVIPGTAIGTLPEAPETDDSQLFLGWQIGDTEEYLTADTVITEDMTVRAAYGEMEFCEIYFHDMDPDGIDRESSGQDVQVSQMSIPADSTIADNLMGEALIHDGTPVEDCIWYTLAEDGTKQPYTLDTPVTGELHLYTYSYRVSLNLASPAAQGFSFFGLGRSVDVSVGDDDILRMTIREGTHPTAADFVSEGKDYTLYKWYDSNGNAVSLRDIIENGVTENIEASSDGSTTMNSWTIRARFFAYVDDAWKQVYSGQILSVVSGGRYNVSVAQMEAIYGPFGFRASGIDSTGDLIFTHTDEGGTSLWSCTPARLGEFGNWFIPGLTHSGTCDFYYVPSNTGAANGVQRSNFESKNAFYSVTVEDARNLFLEDEDIPGVRYVLKNSDTTVTLPTPEGGCTWQYNGEDLTDTGTDNGDGTTTYTFPNVTAPILISSTDHSQTVNVHFYAIVDEARMLVAQEEVAVFRFDSVARWRFPETVLEDVYSDFGLEVTSPEDQYHFAFCSGNNADADIWNDVALHESDGLYYIGLEESTDSDIYFYYLPNVTGMTSTGNASQRNNWTAYRKSDSFYSVRVKDTEHLFYQNGELPRVSYVLTGGTVEVTLRSPYETFSWEYDGMWLGGSGNGDGTTTYVIDDVTAPVVIAAGDMIRNISVSDPGNLIYDAGEEQPSMQIITGQDATITLLRKDGIDWLANGKGIAGTVSEDGTTVTYTFTGVKEHIELTPIRLLDSIGLFYQIVLDDSHNIVGAAPTIRGGATYAEIFSGDDSYIVPTPDITCYIRTGSNALISVVFAGWDMDDDGEVDFAAGQQMNLAELSQYGQDIALTSVWDDQSNKGSVSFYINLEMQVADHSGTTQETPDENYSGAVYGTTLTITPEPSAYPSVSVIEAASQRDTAATDAIIRTLGTGYTGMYDGKNRTFVLGNFPDDESVLASVRAQQEAYIRTFEASAYYDPDDPTNVEAYRSVMQLDDKGNPTNAPLYRIICAEDAEGTLRYLAPDELTSENCTVRWYVFKYEGSNCWHVDGVLVKKQGQLTVTKTFYGNAAAIEAVKAQDYHISVLDGDKEVYSLNLQPYDADSNRSGYVAYDQNTETYTWTITLTSNKQFTLKERNYIVDSDVVAGANMATLAEYAVVNGHDGDDVSRMTYSDSGVTVTARAYSTDIDYTHFKTVRFHNSYLPTNAMMLRKVDDSGNKLPGIRFQLKKGEEPVSLYRDGSGTYYIYDPSASDSITAEPVDAITTDTLGQAVIIGLKDTRFAGQYALVELEAPIGYSRIEEEMIFHLDENGVLRVEGESSYITLLEDGTTLQVTNTANTMDVTVKKIWSDGTDREVTVALFLNGAAMSSEYAVRLDGSNGWTHTWENLPAFVGGKLARYTIRETWIGSSAYSGTIDDGYEDYVVTYASPAYTYDAYGVPTSVLLTVTNRTDSGEVEFTKVDPSNTGLGGAVFRMYTDEACQNAYGRPVTSDENGRVTFGSMAAGTYYMKEIQSPEGYQPNDTVYSVKVTGFGTTIHRTDTGEAVTTIVNIPANANLRLQKTDDRGNSLTDAVFELYQKNADDGWDKVFIDGNSSFAVDENGIFDFTELPNGEYKLVETAAPAGYYRLTEEIPFTISLGRVSCFQTRSSYWTFTDGNPATITVVNVPGSELPQTGGMGTHLGTMVGLLMMAGSLMYYILLRRKREKGCG